jgi:hypothetical protein
MNKNVKNLLLTAVGLALAAQTASAGNTYNANGDVLLGFWGNGGANNVVFDLGNISQFANGSSFDLSTVGYSASQVNNIQSVPTAPNWNTVTWGMVGVVGTGLPRSVAVTDPGGLNGNVNAFPIDALGAVSTINNMGNAYATQAGANILNPTTVKMVNGTGNSFSGNGVDLSGNLNTSGSGYNVSGTTTIVFEELTGNNDPTLLGTLTFDTSNGSMFYTGNPALAVPEPSMYGVLAAGGVLLLSLRRRLA